MFNPGHTTINVFGQGMPNIPLLILTSSEQASPQGLARAWGAAFVLLGAILLANIGARLLLAPLAPATWNMTIREHAREPRAPGPWHAPASTDSDRRPSPADGDGIAKEPTRRAVTRPVVFDIRDMSVSYGAKRALDWTTLKIYRHMVTAVIGPSGCGKSTFLRSLNRMNDSIPGFRLGGEILYHGHDLYGAGANRVEVRRRIGMVFQKPNPFPKSIYDNVAWAPRNLGMKQDLDERVERALRAARRCGTRSRTG